MKLLISLLILKISVTSESNRRSFPRKLESSHEEDEISGEGEKHPCEIQKKENEKKTSEEE